MPTYDYIVVGSGIAGLYAALKARESGSVLVITKGTLDETNTRHAQGGIAAAIGPDDSPAFHFRDTVEAGAGLCDPEAVSILTEEAADRIQDLVRFGVSFDTVQGEVALAREGAHTMPRVLHAGGDATGEWIEVALGRRARESGISILEHCLVTDLLVEGGAVAGVRALDLDRGASEEVQGRFIILATGGAGRLFRYTTNVAVATGDGVALAYRAGAAIADMEFFQFHPTALYLSGAPPFLISEAVRGEGAILRNLEGRAFAKDYDPRGELAPRDIVARAIVAEMRRTGTDHVVLDLTHLRTRTTTARFPTIYSRCLAWGIDFTRQPIPVAPAAHYMMGGVLTTTWGETSLPGLFACGECACTGVHGANRLASNSLLETVVFGQRVVERTQALRKSAASFRPPDTSQAQPLPARRGTMEVGPPASAALQSTMWTQVGIVRSGAGLRQAVETLASWEAQARPAPDLASQELANMLVVGRLMAEAALWREESRGAHYREDYPDPSPQWARRLIYRRPQGGAGGLP